MVLDRRWQLNNQVGVPMPIRRSCAVKALIWSTMAAPRAKTFLWLAARGRCLTTDNLAIKGIPHNPVCSLCYAAPGTATHLLAGCSFSKQLWMMVISKLGGSFLNLAPIVNSHQQCLHLKNNWMMQLHLLPANKMKE